jgi:hypothetical protein
MSRRTLVAVIGAAFALVVALAVLTPTVIATDDGPSVRIVRVDTPQAVPVPRGGRTLPGLPSRPFRNLRSCLQEHGLGMRNRATPPDLQTMRDALRACRVTLPGLSSNP